MSVLSHNEAEVLDAMRWIHKRQASPDSIAVGEIRGRAFLASRVHYDSTHYALNRLIEKGLVEKPSRGYYRVVEGAS